MPFGGIVVRDQEFQSDNLVFQVPRPLTEANCAHACDNSNKTGKSRALLIALVRVVFAFVVASPLLELFA